MSKRLPLFIAALLVCLQWFSLPVAAQKAAAPQSFVTVFQSGEAGYRCFRIPALARSPAGRLFAFAEGRVSGCADFGDVDIVMKTSDDGGHSWSPLQVVVSFDSLQCGNAAPVFDPYDPPGRLFLFYNTGDAEEWKLRQGEGCRRVWFIGSDDGGLHWSAPQEITGQVHRPKPDTADWRSYANTPGHAVQLKNGRILVPANHSAGAPQEAFRDYRAHAFYTDDHGKTFHLSDDVPYPGSNESSAALLPGGGILMSIRNQSGEPRNRLLAVSHDGGAHWDSVWVATDLPDPVCEGSLLNMTLKNGLPVLLHCNPDSPDKRCCLTLKMSLDEGRHWSPTRVVYSGSAAYSDLVDAGGGIAGVLFEADDYSKVLFCRVGVEP